MDDEAKRYAAIRTRRGEGERRGGQEKEDELGGEARGKKCDVSEKGEKRIK